MPQAGSGRPAPGAPLTLQAADRSRARRQSGDRRGAAARRHRRRRPRGRRRAAQSRSHRSRSSKETPKQAFGCRRAARTWWQARTSASRSARRRSRSGEAELAATIAQVRNDVRRAYFDAARRRPPTGACCGELRDLARRARDAAQARFDRGDAPRLEVLQAELALAAARERGDRGRRRGGGRGSRLNALLGQPLDTATIAGDAARRRAPSPGRGGPRSRPQPTPASQLSSTGGSTSSARALPRRGAPRARRHADRDADARRGARVHLRLARRRGDHAAALHAAHAPACWSSRRRSTQLIARARRRRCSHHRRGTAAAAAAEAQRQRHCPLPRRDPAAGAAGRAAGAGLPTARPDRHRRVAPGAAGDARRPPASLDAVAQFQTALADLERAIGAPLP